MFKKGKVIFRVYDSKGKEVTDDYTWYLNQYGDLCYETSDIDMPVQEVEEKEGYYYLFDVVS